MYAILSYLSLYLKQTLVKCSPVWGHKALQAIPSAANSAAIPSVHIDMLYFAMVYAT